MEKYVILLSLSFFCCAFEKIKWNKMDINIVIKLQFSANIPCPNVCILKYKLHEFGYKNTFQNWWSYVGSLSLYWCATKLNNKTCFITQTPYINTTSGKRIESHGSFFLFFVWLFLDLFWFLNEIYISRIVTYLHEIKRYISLIRN